MILVKQNLISFNCCDYQAVTIAFFQLVDATNKEDISTLTNAMQYYCHASLVYGVADDTVDEYIIKGSTATLECLNRLCKGII